MSSSRLLRLIGLIRSIRQNQRCMILAGCRRQAITTHWWIQGGRQGGAPSPSGVQILSFSCSFGQKNWKTIALLGVGAPPWGKSWIRHCYWLDFNPFRFGFSARQISSEYRLNVKYVYRRHGVQIKARFIISHCPSVTTWTVYLSTSSLATTSFYGSVLGLAIW